MKPLWIVGGLAAAVGGYMFWSRSKEEADAAAKGRGGVQGAPPVSPLGPVQKELAMPVTGLRWYPMPIEEVGNVPRNALNPDLGSDVFFGLEYAPTEDQRLVKASVMEVGHFEGEPAVIVAVEDETPMVQYSLEHVPAGATFLVRVRDLVAPAVWTQAKAMEVSV